MTSTPGQPRQRDADRSRSAILDAAEALFASNGFEAVTMAQIGAAAGLSRGTPGYFFTSKDALHDAVVNRAETTLRRLVETAGLRDALGARDRATHVEDAIRAFLTLLVERRAIVALVERGVQSADGQPPHASAIRALLPEGAAQADASHLTALALCWFPLSQPDAARALGFDVEAPDFVARWGAHVVGVLNGQLVTSDSVGLPPAPEPLDNGSLHPVDDGDPPTKKKKKKKKKKP